LASRRRRRKTIGKVVSDVERRVRVVEKRPGAKRIKRNVVTAEKIQYRAIVAKNVATDAITPTEVSFGTTTVSATEPTENLKDGTTWVDPTTGTAKVYDTDAEDFVELAAVDLTARASADGKNTIYRQNAEPTGGTYVTGDTWFDEDDNNRIYRYNGTAWVALQLGGNALANISANAINTGTLNANNITVSNLDVGTMTTGNLAASRISAGTISASVLMTSPTITTGSSGNYVRISSSNANQIKFHSTNQASGYPGLVYSTSSGNTSIGSSEIYIEAPRFSGASAVAPYIVLSQRDNDGTGAFGTVIIHAGSSASGSYILMGAPTYAVAVEVGGTTGGSTFQVNGTINAYTAVTSDGYMSADYFAASGNVAENISVARNIHVESVATSAVSSGGSSSGYYNGAIVLVREA
jgi:hypothetical protein